MQRRPSGIYVPRFYAPWGAMVGSSQQVPRLAVYDGTPAAPVPVAGPELVTNGSFEVDASGWSTNGGSTLTGGVAGGQSGNCLQATRGATQLAGSQTIATTAGIWYQVSLYGKNGTGTCYARFSGLTGLLSFGGVWTNYAAVLRGVGASSIIQLEIDPAGTSFYDEVSMKALTLSSLLSLAVDPGQKEGRVQSRPTLTSLTQCGHAIWVDNPASPLYGVFGYHDGTTMRLAKVVNGTWTTLISQATAYVAGAVLETQTTATTVALYYNGIQIGITQTISDAGMGTKVCGFSTKATNTPGRIVVLLG